MKAKTSTKRILTLASLALTAACAGGVGGRELTVPSGTVLTVEFTETLSSDSSRVGERFRATVLEPIVIDGRTAIDAGSTVVGRVVEAVPSRKIGGKARLGLDFDAVQLGSGEEVRIEATLSSVAKSQTKKDAATIGGATAGGAVLGRIIGHQGGEDADGTAIGAVVGAAIGTGIAASNRGQAALIPAGATAHIELDSPVQVTAES
jgi:hypothetical protein